ncbi:alkyl hydroperoxide reductase subunit F [Gayadomonas joobiniege]|uniref:alkyl hydroperoxide reductase subunit F n=1 Tax=Gayadomonas joobiniege TaxID=1234606 RepID=UPI0003752024|nr:alkyl hydroperoxide reductase subunit F [Gayadomonas joobiniege]
MLDTKIKQQLQSHFAALKNKVELSLKVNDSAKAKELITLAEDLASLSPLIEISENEAQADRAPVLVVKNANDQNKVQFAGVPMGHEFTSLILALLQAGGHPVKQSAEVIEQIKGLNQPLKFETYISLSCQNCPEVVQALNLIALLNPNVEHTMIDGALFENEVKQRNIMAVPSVYLNGESFAQGRISLAEILNKVDSGAAEKAAAALNQKDDYDVLVVGGGPAGASAAIYAARKGLKTGIVAERFGGQVMDTVGIENFISVKATEGPKLVAGLEEHVKDYDVDIIQNQLASSLSRNDLIEVGLKSGAQLKSKSVILATGARWREMNVPGEQAYRGKGVAYCPHCDGPLFKGKKVAVIGGGNSGIEAAIDLAGIVEHVTVLEFADTLRADEVLQKKANSLPNIKIIKQAQTTEVVGDGAKVTALKYLDRRDNSEHQIELAGIFVQIGLVPNSEFLKDSLELSPRGEIIIDHKGETSMPGVFAAGDVTTSPYKQIIIAMGSGATASLSAFDYLIRLQPDADDSSQAA